MNCILWSMGDASLHGMGTSSGARQCGVTHVPGLKCYLCLRTVPVCHLTRGWSGPAADQFVTAGPHARPAAQPQVVSLTLPRRGEMTKQFEGKVALVTGAASGIGRASALAFAREGAKTVVADVLVEGGEETVRII